MHLAEFLATKFSGGIRYLDAANLCLALYCVDILPAGAVDDALSMPVIAEAFAKLAQRGLITEYVSHDAVLFGANYHAIEDKGHWIEVQASAPKKGMRSDVERVTRLKKLMHD